jgi:hypothetical protein
MGHKSLGARLAHRDAIEARLAEKEPPISKLGRGFLAMYRPAAARAAQAEGEGRSAGVVVA